MLYETLNDVRLPKIGFGTWRVGGGSSADRSQDKRALGALLSALELGYTHFDTAEMYAAGHTEELLGRAIREFGCARNSLFLTSKVMPEHLRYEQVLRACDASLRRLQAEYLDLYLIHWPRPGMKLGETFRALNRLVTDGRVRHLGVSNFDLRLLKASQEVSEAPIITDQVPYSLRDRSYALNGVLAYCQAHDIVVTAYSPVERGHLKPDSSLLAVAAAHGATPYQVALAWLVAQPRVVAIPMSHDPEHQKTNFEAGRIALRAADVALLS